MIGVVGTMTAMSRASLVSFFCLLTMWSVPLQSASAGEPSAPRIVGYYASWTAYTGYTPARIRGELLTHINYAFANISDDGRAILGDACLDAGLCSGQQGAAALASGNFAQLRELKTRYPHLKILVSIGGWTWSRNFSDVALNPGARSRFVASALEVFLDQWPGLFDGFDLDWEYPVTGGRPENKYRPSDWRNYALLIAEFRRQLDRRGSAASRRYLLTIAAPSFLADDADHSVWSQIGDLVDWINLMTYDYHTGGAVAHFNAPLFAADDDPAPGMNVHATVERYLEAGVPAGKITMGLPFFGYGYSGVPNERNGLFQTANRDQSGKQWGVGAISFRELRDAHHRKFKRFWHPEAQVPWLFNDEASVWISYDDLQSIAKKVNYARRRSLGGVMIWELSGDDGSLLPGIHLELHPRAGHVAPR
jgi:chitinase